jgi:hypothetical protein
MPLLNALSCNTNLARLCVLGNSGLQKDTILNLTLPKRGNQVSFFLFLFYLFLPLSLSVFFIFIYIV